VNTGSEIRTVEDDTTFAAEDAAAMYRADALASCLLLYAKFGKRPNRAWTPTAMLAAASKITGRTYKRGQCELAAADLKRWADDMAAALPITRPESVMNTRARPSKVRCGT
jgi:hypothetical protein